MAENRCLYRTLTIVCSSGAYKLDIHAQLVADVKRKVDFRPGELAVAIGHDHGLCIRGKNRDPQLPIVEDALDIKKTGFWRGGGYIG